MVFREFLHQWREPWSTFLVSYVMLTLIHGALVFTYPTFFKAILHLDALKAKNTFLNKLWVTNCVPICFEFNDNFKITLFSMRKWQNTENKTTVAADLKSQCLVLLFL